MSQQSDKARGKLCFVIGPIGKELSDTRKHSDLLLNAIIKATLEHEEFSYTVRRADEDADPGMIGDRVVSDIIKADLVVADLTDLNPNAFYELGIRHATRLPTIHIAKLGTLLPFDNIAHRTIFVDLGDWHSQQSARERLAESTRAVEKPGFRVSNPVTQAGANFELRASGDPKDVYLAEIIERMNTLESILYRDSPQYYGQTPQDNKSIMQMESLKRTADRLARNPSITNEEIKIEINRVALTRGIKLESVVVDDGAISVYGEEFGFTKRRND